MHTNQRQGRPAHARLAGAALLALLGTACSGLGAGGGPTVASARLVEQIDRVSVETERSEETVDDALERLHRPHDRFEHLSGVAPHRRATLRLTH